MKRLGILVMVVAVVALASSAMAVDIGGKLKGATKKAGRAAIETQMNNEIKKKMGDCSFKTGTTQTTCNLNKVVAGLTAAHEVLENSGLANDCDIHVEANAPDYSLANDRANTVRNKLKQSVGYWDYYVSGKKKAPHNELKVWVKLN